MTYDGSVSVDREIARIRKMKDPVERELAIRSELQPLIAELTQEALLMRAEAVYDIWQTGVPMEKIARMIKCSKPLVQQMVARWRTVLGEK